MVRLQLCEEVGDRFTFLGSGASGSQGGDWFLAERLEQRIVDPRPDVVGAQRRTAMPGYRAGCADTAAASGWPSL